MAACFALQLSPWTHSKIPGSGWSIRYGTGPATPRHRDTVTMEIHVAKPELFVAILRLPGIRHFFGGFDHHVHRDWNTGTLEH
ncbi:hypothetical protein K504DRAFT_497937 [Pleomassaria siparia CBS 279.74]|uniref:Uncharacterized protein n=1 Tax=Pleomassaria siparia CBS 279.74 TaxID=1314801 RepID=A0A6G1KJU1_9PLEO|nr:hypothetical protein K504DRAFT_497937 [Pleomassaria siparia CBS 279.74]